MVRPDTQFDRLPPHNIADEKALVGSFILAAGERDVLLVNEVRGIIDPGDFYQADHEAIWRVVCDLVDAGKDIDGRVVSSELERRQMLAEVGGNAYLGELLNCVPSYHHAVTYAESVRDLARRRQLIALSNQMLRDAYAPVRIDGVDDLIGKAATEISRIASEGRRCDYQNIGQILDGTVAEMSRDATRMVRTGFDQLDAETGGVELGEMVVIGARPSMGKSTLLKQLALQMARLGTPVGFISLEEGAFKIGRNLLSSMTGIENTRIRRGMGSLSPLDLQNIGKAVNDNAGLPFYVSEKARKVRDIKAQVATWKARHGIQVLIIDYLQRVRGAEGKDRYEQVSNTSLEISDLIKENGVAGFVAVQLSRGVEGRQDKRPNMSDIRESGQIEQDADAIIFLHREDYYHTADMNYTPTERAELIIAKWRDSKRGVIVNLKSNMRYQRFDPINLDPFTNDDVF